MQTLAIVPSFDEFKDGRASLSSRREGLAGTFGFERAEKALHDRIVKAISGTAHADLALGMGQGLLIGLAGILAALIRMMQQTIRWMAL